MKIFLTVFKLWSGHDFYSKNFKGALSVKNVGGVGFLVLCTLADDGLYLYKVS